MGIPEILAPVGNMEMLAAAIDAKADSVYIGLKELNMRANASNFSSDELDSLVSKCHENDIKVYVGLNTVMFDSDIDSVNDALEAIKNAHADAVIAWDLAVLKLAKDIGVEVHLSTQASSSNSLSVSEYAKLGAKRIVLARECSLDQIKRIKKNNPDVEIEAFIHGAMCVAVSGRCFISESLYGKSANKGECIQPCRRSYIIKDPETGEELEVSNNYIMSPKDLCTIDIIDKLIDAGIDCFKIEGRARSPEYVKVVVECYKEAIELHSNKILTEEKKMELKGTLAKVYNRGFSTGFFMGKPIDEWSNAYGSQSTKVKEYIGYIANYYDKAKAAEVKLETGSLNIDDTVLIIGPTTGCIELNVDSMQIKNEDVDSVSKGQSVGIKINAKVRKNDKVYLWKDRDKKD